jgi:hypothetical protein
LGSKLLCAAHVTSLSFHYNFSAIKPHNSTNLGDGMVFYVGPWPRRLPRPLQQPQQHGHNFSASFTSNFTFAIKPHNSTNQGDGMVFYVGPWPPNQSRDSRGGFLGLFNNPNNTTTTIDGVFLPTVAVEFDAFRNNDWDPIGV